jgi:ribonucleoside-diphosphate reductase alpha chain
MEGVMTARQRLPDRRGHQVVNVEHGGFQLIVGVGRYQDGRLGEIFIDSGAKTGSAVDTVLKDSAVPVSLLLQHGADVAVIRRALSRTGPITAVFDKIGGAA